MVKTSDIEEANAILKGFADCYLTVERYSATFRKINIKLSKDNTKEVISISILGCKKLSGKFTYSNAYLKISKVDDYFIIRDKYTNFELLSDDSFSLWKGFEIEFLTNQLSYAISYIANKK